MPAFVSWVDYSSEERLRMRQAVALFEEKDTRDELGIGSIRDAIADALFPGTSVVQTRLRYALFIPWTYAQLEADRRTSAATVERRARDAELTLIEPLQQGDDQLGIIGIRSGKSLQRLPSSVYWLALQRWGIFRPTSTMDQYHRGWDRLRAARQHQLPTDDLGILPGASVTWHPALPPAPEDFPQAASFALRPEDADFLRGRILEACSGSLLAHAATHAGACPHLAAASPWDAFFAHRRELSPDLVQTVALARRFAFLVQGAALAYNLALARTAAGRGDLAGQLESAITQWADTASNLVVADASLDELWSFCASRANVSPRTREFLEAWRALLVAHGYEGATKAPATHELVERRERLLKGSRSRFGNARAIETWGGQAGTGLLTYRWGTVQRFLGDLYQGLKGAES